MEELQLALTNGGWKAFDYRTAALMVKLFDSDYSGSIGLHEFAQLWGYLIQWKGAFDAYDLDKSGTISMEELQNVS